MMARLARVIVQPDRAGVAYFHELVAAQSAARPGSLAVVSDTERWTYADLDRESRRVELSLRAGGIGAGAIVGLCIDRSPRVVSTLLGILRAGGAFLPLDPAYPAERLGYMLADARPGIVLVDGDSGERLPVHPGKTIHLDAMTAPVEAPGSPPGLDPESLAYVIYTSGSTGRPKGVLVPHRGIENLARAQIQAFGVGPESRILQFASLNFDAAIAEIAVALCAGASLHLASRDRLLPGGPLEALLAERRITHLTLPPSLAALMPADTLPSTLILAGEACGAALVGRLADGRNLFNAYGPTEATVCATIGRCRADGGPPSIGHAIDGVTVDLLDEDGQAVLDGSPGEIHIGGVGVANGYLGLRERTAERFLTHGGKRVYRTGDLGRRRPDGEFEFLGRIDRQIKLHGHRIEPGEIESVIMAQPGVAAATTLLRGSAEAARLTAYVVGHNGATPDRKVLRAHLTTRLPGWMIPADIVFLRQMPLTPNGKIDPDRLPAPGAEAHSFDTPLILPRDSLELVLAAAFREVLGLETVGVRDDFFLLGGDSLQAARIMARVEDTTGKRLPLDAFLTDATIENLAVRMRAGRGSTRLSPLVPLSTTGDGPPLLLVHPAGGTVLAYVELAQALAGKAPVYGLRAIGMEPGETPLESVEAMADAYVAAVRSELNPQLWRLAGWSFGAAIAFEMARRLRAMGAAVAPPLILDAPVRHMAGAAAEGDIIQRVIRMYGDMQAIQPEETSAGASSDRIHQMVDAAVASGIFPPDFGMAQARRLARVIACCFRAGEVYRPAAATGDAILIRAADNPMKAEDERLGWGDVVTGRLDMRYLPGTHTSILRRPNVDALAALMQEDIRVASDVPDRIPFATIAGSQ